MNYKLMHYTKRYLELRANSRKISVTRRSLFVQRIADCVLRFATSLALLLIGNRFLLKALGQLAGKSNVKFVIAVGKFIMSRIVIGPNHPECAFQGR